MKELLEQIVIELKKINENMEMMNDIAISHHISTGQIEMDEVDDLSYPDLDS